MGVTARHAVQQVDRILSNPGIDVEVLAARTALGLGGVATYSDGGVQRNGTQPGLLT